MGFPMHPVVPACILEFSLPEASNPVLSGGFSAEIMRLDSEKSSKSWLLSLLAGLGQSGNVLA